MVLVFAKYSHFVTENFDFTTKIVENIGLSALIYVAIK